MGADALAALTEPAARRWVDAHEWQKGQPYLRRLGDFRRRPADGGTEDRAAAQGQERSRVTVTVCEGRVADADCTCPVGSGACKHVAALLAQLTQDVAPFVPEADLGSVIGSLERPALERLVRRMLERAPELEVLVYAQAGLADTDDLTPRIRAALTDLGRVALTEELLYREEDLTSAALLTVQAAQRLAAQRHRRAYAEAAAALRPLLGRLGECETRRLVAAAFPELTRLPALRDELRQAGLL